MPSTVFWWFISIFSQNLINWMMVLPFFKWLWSFWKVGRDEIKNGGEMWKEKLQKPSSSDCPSTPNISAFLYRLSSRSPCLPLSCPSSASNRFYALWAGWCWSPARLSRWPTATWARQSTRWALTPLSKNVWKMSSKRKAAMLIPL